MASLRKRLEAVAAGQSDTLPVMSRDESRAAAAKVLALLAAAKEAPRCHRCLESGCVRLCHDDCDCPCHRVTAAIATFEEEPHATAP